MSKPDLIEGSLQELSRQSFEPALNRYFQHGDYRYKPLTEYHYSEAAVSATSPLLTTLPTNSDFGNPLKMHQSSSSLAPGLVFLNAADSKWAMFNSYYTQSWQPGRPPSNCGSVSDSGESDTIPATHLAPSPSLLDPTGQHSSPPQVSINPAESRRIRRQQQNRKAQRTYRERQTCLLTTAKEQVRYLTQKLDDLNRANAALEVRAKALSERVGILERTNNGPPHRCGDFDSFDFPQLR